MTGEPVKQKSVDRFQDGMETVLDRMDSYWLADKKFIGGSEISIADILAVCELMQPGECSRLTVAYPNKSRFGCAPLLKRVMANMYNVLLHVVEISLTLVCRSIAENVL